MKKILIIITILFAIADAKSQNTRLENSTLWEVSGNGTTAPSYLFGTIHMLCEADYIINEKVQAAFERSKALTVEVNMLDSLALAGMQKAMFSKTKISELITKKEAAELDSILKKEYGVNLAMVDNFKPIGVASFMLMKAVGCANFKTMDIELAKNAKAKGMKINNFETILGQMEILEKATTPSEMVSQMKLGNEYKPLFAKMVEFYKAENITELDNLLKDRRFMSEKAEVLMLKNRNLEWAEKIPNMIKNESNFMAFGTAHLPGEFGIINLLRKKGYTVKPILN